jgi:hypothetical protein
MPHFSESGHDEVICQKCGRIVNTGKEKVEWRPDITGNQSAGNVCVPCIQQFGTRVFNKKMLRAQQDELAGRLSGHLECSWLIAAMRDAGFSDRVLRKTQERIQNSTKETIQFSIWDEIVG